MYAGSESRSATPDVPDNISESGSLAENRTVREKKVDLEKPDFIFVFITLRGYVAHTVTN